MVKFEQVNGGWMCTFRLSSMTTLKKKKRKKNKKKNRTKNKKFAFYRDLHNDQIFCYLPVLHLYRILKIVLK